MQDAMTLYFNGEKSAGLLLAGAAAAVLLLAVIIVRSTADLRSFAVTLAVVALAEIALGVGLYLRTGPQVSGLSRQLASDEGAFVESESARMARVQRNFVFIEYAELAIIVVAALVAVTYKPRTTVAGIALGMLIHASILLAFDVIAERRGSVYVSSLAAAARSR
jgi:hypothetical protein